MTTEKKAKTRNKDLFIISLHSQKGGVGKTSLAIAIACVCKHHNLEPFIIDADLTGCSLLDVLGPKHTPKNNKWLNTFLLAPPNQYLDMLSNSATLNDMQLPYSHGGGELFHYVPSSPIYTDVSKIVPLIAQEDHLHFFSSRLEDLIAKLAGRFQAIIVDHGPGLFGLSKAIFEKSFELWMQNSKKNVDSSPRLRRLLLDYEIKTFPILVMTADETDFKASIPTLAEMLEKSPILAEKKDAFASMPPTLVNKAASKQSVEVAERIVAGLKTIKGRGGKLLPMLIDRLHKSFSKTGFQVCPFVNNFFMEKVPLDVLRYFNVADQRLPDQRPLPSSTWVSSVVKYVEKLIGTSGRD